MSTVNSTEIVDWAYKVMDLKFVTVETFVIQLIILLVILWVLNKFVFKPYLAYLDEWEIKQKKLEDDYKNIDKLIKDAEEEKESILSEARNKADEVLKNSEAVAKQKRLSILDNAEKEAKSILEAWKSNVEKERSTMLNNVKSKLVDLIVSFNKKIFTKETVNKDFIEKELGAIK